MKTLTLVPLNNTWVNPEEIAAIADDSFGQPYAVITLRNNQCSVVIKNMTADQVVERLQKHFESTTAEEKLVVDAVSCLKSAAKAFPDDCDPIRLAAGIKDVHDLLKKSKDESN